jgi:hypothetical protein
MATAKGTAYGLNAGVATSRPSTALSTEIDGVMTPSPQNSAAPSRPRITTEPYWRDPRPTADDANAVSAMMPPSPRLSARRIRTTYFSATTSIRVQTITEMTPMMFAAVSPMPWTGLNDSCTAYSGLVPISP